MADTNPTRRRFLLLAGTTATIGLAGCSSGASAPQDTGTAAPTETAAPTTASSSETGHNDESGHGHDEGGHTDDEEHTDDAGHPDDGSHDEEVHADEDGHADDETTVHETEDHHGGHGHGDPVGDPVEHAEVSMVTGDHGYHFEPHIVRVVPGGTVTFHNESGAHATAAYHPDNGKQLRIPESAAPWDSGTLTEQGATFEITLDEEGVYDFYCAPHEGLGMIGSVIVGEPDPHGQPGLSEPSTAMPEKVRTKIASLNERVDEALGHTH